MLATERRAMAYVDPGSGLLALQSIGSMLAAAAFFMRRRIMGLFNKKKPLTGVDPRLSGSRVDGAERRFSQRRMTNGTPTATFRDPAGSLSLEGDFAIRTIHPEAREQVMEFVTSQFCNRLQDRGDMVGITIRDTPAGLQLLHPRVPVPTYPWEWTPSQWLAAAELTLTLCAEALNEGWVLKDATPLNILFVGSRPVLVDVLSFERWDPAPKEYPSHIWLAYGQYVRTFLLPLLMNRMLSWPLELSLFKRDGYEPVELYKALSWWQRFSPERSGR